MNAHLLHPHHGGGLAALFVAVLLIGEFAWLKLSGRDGYDLKESAASLAVAAGQVVIRGATYALLAPIFLFVYEHRLFEPQLHGALAWTGFLLLSELSYYWFHRMSHTVRWLWTTHSVHHSPTRLNLSCAYRLGWTTGISGGWLFLVPLVWIGYSPVAVFGMYAANLAIQFFLHTEVVGRLGPLEWIFNTPSHHRVHHATNEGYVDKNFGGVLILYDRLFGTHATEPANERLQYGLIGAEPRYNPLAIAFGEWLALGRDLLKTSGPKEALRVAFGKP